MIRTGNWLAGLVLLLMVSVPAFPQVTIYTPPTKSNCPRSQKQADIWYFGENAGIDFTSGTAVPLTNENVMTAFKASGVISDSLGNLLFFSNGKKVWDRNFNMMPNGTNLSGDIGVTQPCIIIPKPESDSLYYLFSLDVMAFMPDNSYTTRGLTYSIVDMARNGGMGNIGDSLNRPLLTPVTQKITAVKNANEKDYWVIVHQWDSDKFFAYPVTSNGLESSVVSSVGAVHGTGFAGQTNALGYMKASPDGTKIALAITGSNLIQVFDFNNSTGQITNPVSYTTTIPGISPYGIEFSPDSKILYASLLQIVGNGPPSRPSYIIQFDLKNNGLTNPVTIDSVPGVRLAAMQLGVDGRIYISRTINLVTKKDSLDVIYNPSRPGVACNYSLLSYVPDSRFPLTVGRFGMYSLPNVMQSWLDIPLFTYDSCCFGDITKFTITNKANIESVMWNFGDGNTSAVQDPTHVYANPGLYTVSLTETFNGQSFTDSLQVLINPLPQVQLGDTILLYTGAAINLHAGGGFMQYDWTTGSTDSIIEVSSQGDYGVFVKDYHCCINSDSVYIKVFAYYIPNAFTPDNDGLNDIFRVVGLYRNINFSMMIYDRWGQELFTSDNIDTGWDGTFKNQPCPPDTYVWRVNIQFLGQDIVSTGSIVLKGTVILLK
jgi:gliding motility-associated-like protein